MNHANPKSSLCPLTRKTHTFKVGEASRLNIKVLANKIYHQFSYLISPTLGSIPVMDQSRQNMLVLSRFPFRLVSLVFFFFTGYILVKSIFNVVTFFSHRKSQEIFY
jgi:hypothetical protein